tara:strand:- start:474 stop:887 length:414 start_codon:yes stop_codon:yes gene_type:complete
MSEVGQTHETEKAATAFMEHLIAQIEEHQTYGQRMREVEPNSAQLVLNYHTHNQGEDFCISICRKNAPVLAIMGQTAELDELVHISHISKSEEQCLPLMTMLAVTLQTHYRLARMPEVYFNGSIYTGTKKTGEHPVH